MITSMNSLYKNLLFLFFFGFVPFLNAKNIQNDFNARFFNRVYSILSVHWNPFGMYLCIHVLNLKCIKNANKLIFALFFLLVFIIFFFRESKNKTDYIKFKEKTHTYIIFEIKTKIEHFNVFLSKKYAFFYHLYERI